jgi:hypothetical protein
MYIPCWIIYFLLNYYHLPITSCLLWVFLVFSHPADTLITARFSIDLAYIQTCCRLFIDASQLYGALCPTSRHHACMPATDYVPKQAIQSLGHVFAFHCTYKSSLYSRSDDLASLWPIKTFVSNDSKQRMHLQWISRPSIVFCSWKTYKY